MTKIGRNSPRGPKIQDAMPAWATGRRNRGPRRSRIRWSTWLFIALALVGLVIYAALPEPPFLLGGAPLTGPVERVADGDTIEVAGQRIRLTGMDAPEWNQTCRTAGGDDWQCGRVAAERMRELTGGRTLTCRPEGHDRYGRLLATCRDGKTDVAEVLVAEGLAVATDAYSSAEARARQAGKGLWQGDFDLPATWRAREADAPEASAGNPSRFERFLSWLMGLFSS